MINDRVITISTAGSRKAINWKSQSIRISELFDKLKTPIRGKETLTAYLQMKRFEQDELKDVGGFVGGDIKGRRKKGSVKSRDIITLDLDSCPPESTNAILQRVSSLGMCYAVYSTRKHSPVAPRLRIVVPTDRTMTTEEYEPIARKLAEMIQPELSWFDPTTFQAERLMYWSSCCADSEYVFTYEDKPFLSADGVLSKYTDWHSFQEWPQVPGEQKLKDKALKKAGDPTEKSGVVGAFCRTYSITQAMEKFIPEVYAATSQDDRYTYTDGSTFGGVILYENDMFLYSHHATDPCGGQLVNSFDMVRIHKFGDLDDDAKTDTPINRLPSYIEMLNFACSDIQVSRLIDEERRQAAIIDFADLEEDEHWTDKLKKNGKKLAQTSENGRIIMRCDKALKSKFGFNEFTNKNMVFGSLPWNDSTAVREWTDADDSGMRDYIECSYGLGRKQAIEDAWVLTNQNNGYHPVKDYLNSCTWDGVKRVDTLFIDYMGADDTTYTRAVTRKTLCAAVARIFEPGIKFDYMLTLVGDQGTGKSTIVKKLGGEWFSDTLTTMQGKEAYEQIQGAWIIEIAELSAMKKADVEAVKHFISKQADMFRKAYGRHTHTYKRQCILIGTTNKYEFLQDITGNRRFWPVDTGVSKATKNVVKDLTPDEVKQIWAEAVTLWRAGETLYLSQEQENTAKEIQEEHRDTAECEGLILEYLDLKVPENWYELSLFERKTFISGNAAGLSGDLKPLGIVCAIGVKKEMLECSDLNSKFVSSQYINGVIEKTGNFKKGKKPIRLKLYGVQRCYYRK